MEILTLEKFFKLLKQHHRWLQTHGNAGQRLRLEGCFIDFEKIPLPDCLASTQFRNCVIQNLEAINLNLADISIENTVLKHCRFHNCELYEAAFHSSDFKSTAFHYCNFNNANLNDTTWELSSSILFSNFESANLKLANLRSIDMKDNINLDKVEDISYCIGDGTYIRTLDVGIHVTYTDKLIALNSDFMTIEEFNNLSNKDIQSYFKGRIADNWNYLFPIIKLALTHFPINC